MTPSFTQFQKVEKRMRTLFTKPPFNIAWQAAIPALAAGCLTFFIVTDPFFHGFLVYFSALITYILAFNGLCIMNTFSTKSRGEYHCAMTFGPQPTSDTNPPYNQPSTSQPPCSYYESHETMSFGRHK